MSIISVRLRLVGMKKVVKPQRMGVRHGHPVVVNRQLCIANAFEQVLEEKTPRFHRFLRRNYDRYGYPFAKHIKKKWAMDVIYYLMKPLGMDLLVGSLLGRSQARKPNCYAIHQADPRRF